MSGSRFSKHGADVACEALVIQSQMDRVDRWNCLKLEISFNPYCMLQDLFIHTPLKGYGEVLTPCFFLFFK